MTFYFRLLFQRLLEELEARYFATDRIIVRHHGNCSYQLKCNYPDVIDVSDTSI